MNLTNDYLLTKADKHLLTPTPLLKWIGYAVVGILCGSAWYVFGKALFVFLTK